VISGFPKSLPTRWFKRVLTHQPQVDETNEREFALGGGHAGIPYAPLVSPEIADQQHVLFKGATTHNDPFAVS
jgi:hypothetical protein